MVEAGIQSSAEDVLTLSEDGAIRAVKKEQGCSDCGEKTTV